MRRPVTEAGGLSTTDGRWVRRGRLFRFSGGLAREDDLDELSRAGVLTVIDLRGREENRSRVSRWADGAGVQYLSLPIPVAGGGALARAARDARDLEHAESIVDGLYRELIDEHALAFARAVAVVAAGTPVAIGCQAGKDRTGVCFALVHSVLGVRDAELAASYSASPPSVEQLRPVAARYLGDDGATSSPLLDVLLQAREPTILRALAYLRERYGGVKEYLIRAGTPPAAITALRRELVDPGGG